MLTGPGAHRTRRLANPHTPLLSFATALPHSPAHSTLCPPWYCQLQSITSLLLNIRVMELSVEDSKCCTPGGMYALQLPGCLHQELPPVSLQSLCQTCGDCTKVWTLKKILNGDWSSVFTDHVCSAEQALLHPAAMRLSASACACIGRTTRLDMTISLAKWSSTFDIKAKSDAGRGAHPAF